MDSPGYAIAPVALLPRLASTLHPVALLHAPQAFKHNIEYQLAGQTTGGILRLVLANVSYVANPAYSSIGANLSTADSVTKQTAKEWR